MFQEQDRETNDPAVARAKTPSVLRWERHMWKVWQNSKLCVTPMLRNERVSSPHLFIPSPRDHCASSMCNTVAGTQYRGWISCVLCFQGFGV